MVEYLAKWFLRRDIRVAIVSRGYGAAEGERNDESRELSEKLPSVPHIQNTDRVAAAKLAEEELGIQLVLLDDGFQHRRLERDLDLVLIDALNPFGFDRIFPRGLLREPVEGLQRAQLIALTRADLVSEQDRSQIRQRVREIAPAAKWAEVAHAATSLVGGAKKLSESERSLKQLASRRVVAFCGLGNPAGFVHTLATTGADVLDFREFPDHHDYARSDIDAICDWISEVGPDMVICTHKDLVKFNVDQLAGVPLRALIVELSVLNGEEEFSGPESSS